MKVKKMRSASKLYFRRVRFTGALTKPEFTLNQTEPIGKCWYVEVIKYSFKDHWLVYKTFNWDAIGPIWHPSHHAKFKTLREVKEWLFIEQL